MPGHDVFVRITDRLPHIRILRIPTLDEGMAHPEHDKHESDDKQCSDIFAVYSFTLKLGARFQKALKHRHDVSRYANLTVRPDALRTERFHHEAPFFARLCDEFGIKRKPIAGDRK